LAPKFRVTTNPLFFFAKIQVNFYINAFARKQQREQKTSGSRVRKHTINQKLIVLTKHTQKQNKRRLDISYIQIPQIIVKI